MSKCRKCGHLNMSSDRECGGCGVIFKDLRREGVSSGEPVTCAWNDYGRPCACRGILNTTGSWYCREHWDKANGLKPLGRGNYLLPYVRSKHAAQWDAWYPQWLERRNRRSLPNPIAREPGDDLSDLVPETVGQA